MGFGESEATELHNPDLIKHIKKENLAWLGHVIRINQAGVAEKVYESKLE
jgi:hypothetical protein